MRDVPQTVGLDLRDLTVHENQILILAGAPYPDGDLAGAYDPPDPVDWNQPWDDECWTDFILEDEEPADLINHPYVSRSNLVLSKEGTHWTCTRVAPNSEDFDHFVTTDDREPALVGPSGLLVRAAGQWRATEATHLPKVSPTTSAGTSVEFLGQTFQLDALPTPPLGSDLQPRRLVLSGGRLWVIGAHTVVFTDDGHRWPPLAFRP